ncbi:MAG: hypothetical protein U0232_25520 [Thermomicrobiales bacterium]
MHDDAARVEQLLYGADPTPRIVAVELANAQTIGLYQRDDAGRVLYTTEPFEPWVLLRDEPSWPRLRGEYRSERLAGDADYRWLVTFRSWSAHNTARTLLEDSGTPRRLPLAGGAISGAVGAHPLQRHGL